MKKRNGNSQDSKKKERHIVTWTHEEDDILRRLIGLHGTKNWTIIASKLKDKTTRQCRRRWYTYLNTDFKKGGWSPEEDMLLCEAQRIFGNRWTEISKVVSGRTDNAVKNRFTTLCKRRAKHEAMAKENKNTCVHSNNKRILLPDGFYAESKSENKISAKKMRRSRILEPIAIKCNSVVNQQIRPPFSVLVRKATDVYNVLAQNHVDDDVLNKNIQGSFLKKDDPKITALMQQAKLLSSLAQKVNAHNTEQSMENAWKVLQDFLNKSKENDLFRYGIPDIDFEIEDLEDLVEDPRNSIAESQPFRRQLDLYDSPASSECSTGSTIRPNPSVDKTKQTQAETQTRNNQEGSELQLTQVELKKEIVSDSNTDQVDILPGEQEFSSPLQVAPLFRSLAAGIPSPQFSESERNFLLKTLGMESPCPCPSANPSQPPPCKRVLLQSL